MREVGFDSLYIKILSSLRTILHSELYAIIINSNIVSKYILIKMWSYFQGRAKLKDTVLPDYRFDKLRVYLIIFIIYYRRLREAFESYWMISVMAAIYVTIIPVAILWKYMIRTITVNMNYWYLFKDKISQNYLEFDHRAIFGLFNRSNGEILKLLSFCILYLSF